MTSENLITTTISYLITYLIEHGYIDFVGAWPVSQQYTSLRYKIFTFVTWKIYQGQIKQSILLEIRHTDGSWSHNGVSK